MPAIPYSEAHGAGQSSYYPPTAPAAPVGLPPHLERAVKAHQATHYGPAICAACRTQRPDAYAANGECPHCPRRTAERAAFQHKARSMALAQQLAAGMIGNSARVVTQAQAVQEDSYRASLHELIEQALG
jgi:hypothetical protein